MRSPTRKGKRVGNEEGQVENGGRSTTGSPS